MWWILLLALLAFLAARSEYEKRHLKVEWTRIKSPKVAKDRTVVFLADLHSHQFGPDNQKLLSAIDQVSPDLVLVGGDMMVTHRETDLQVPLKLMGMLAKKYPIYYGNGNHENRLDRRRDIHGDQYDHYLKALEDMGVVVLVNQGARFGEDLAIAGLDLDKRHYQKHPPKELEPGFAKDRLGEADGSRFQILLCHSPLYFKGYREWGADLSLAGHFHGGTIRIPGLGGVMTPQYQFFLPWCAGEFQEDGKYMVVSRGLGTHSVNIRLNDRPQVVVVKLEALQTEENLL